MTNNNKTKQNRDGVRFFYMRDPDDSRRMITVARKLREGDSNVLQFQFSVNNPKSFAHFSYDYREVVTTFGDAPRKETGRTISVGRLASRPFEVELNGRRQLTALCEVLSDELAARMAAYLWYDNTLNDTNESEKDLIPNCVRRTARVYLEELRQKDARTLSTGSDVVRR